VRFLPMISGFEMRHLVSHGRHGVEQRIEKEVGTS
jgi:hypothetical protein